MCACVPLHVMSPVRKPQNDSHDEVAIDATSQSHCALRWRREVFCVSYQAARKLTSSALNEAVRVIALPSLRLTLLSHRPQLRRPLRREKR